MKFPKLLLLPLLLLIFTNCSSDNDNTTNSPIVTLPPTTPPETENPGPDLQRDYYTHISAGLTHSLGVKADGTLWGWGENKNGNLGTGTSINPYAPVQIDTGTDWKYVYAGYDASFAIKNNGTLWAWGYNYYGRLGIGSSQSQSAPVQVGTDTNWKQIGTCGACTFGIKTDGSLWAWGMYGFLGIPFEDNELLTNIPLQVGTDTDWIQVSGTESQMMALKSDHSIWVMGDNISQFLSNTSPSDYLNSPVRIGNENDWKQISAGKNNFYAIKQNGSLWAWGSNNFGGVGNGGTAPVYQPMQIGNSTWLSIEAGKNRNVIGLQADGSIWVWGKRPGAEIVNDILPTRIGNDSDWAAITAGANAYFALKPNNEIWGWGDRQLYTSNQWGIALLPEPVHP